MLILRLRQSEVALADGRLDEAFQLVTAYQLSTHRRGQRLITRLTNAFVERGNDHLKAERYASAMTDCDKAEKLSGNLPEVIALRTAALGALQSHQRHEQLHHQMLAAARLQVDQGRLDAGAQLLAEAPDDITRARALRHDIEARKNTAALAVRAANLAIDRDEMHLAVEELSRARAADAGNTAVRDLSAKLSAELRRQIQSAFDRGDITLAADLLPRLQHIDPTNPESRQLQRTLTQFQEIWQLIRQGDLAEARILSVHLSLLLPGAKWLKQMSEHLEAADRTMAHIKAAPLAALDIGNINREAMVNPTAPRSSPFPMPQPDALPSQFILHADGVGSFLIVRPAVVTIGPISSSPAPDIAVIAEPSLLPIRIQRADEDYFFNAGGQPGKGKLLTNGQRLELSPRCRFTFRVPSPASTSAVLDLSGARLPRPDIRQIILMDQDLIIGPGASHIQAATLSQSIILHVRGNQLFCQSRQPVLINDQPIDARQALAMGVTLKTAGLSFVITRLSNERR